MAGARGQHGAAVTTQTQLSERPLRASARAAVLRASKILLARQDADGCWPGLSAEDVTLDAECLLAREFLCVRSAEQTSAIAQQLRSRQHADGSWAGGNLSASVLAYLALRLAGDSADAYHLAVAAGWIRDAGGLQSVSVSAQAWLALYGLTGWDDVHVPAPEGFFLPARHGDWAGLSRPAAVSLAIIGTMRTVRRLPFDLAELRGGGREPAGPDRRFRLRVPSAGLARSAEAVVLRRCGQSIIDWQQRQGLPSAPRPAWAGWLVALYALGYPVAHPVLADGLAWLDSVTARPRHTAGQIWTVPRPPVADTTLALAALADAGLAADNPALISAGRWLLGEWITGPADGPGAGPAGWSFGADGYPGIADTAEVLSALAGVELAGRAAVGNAARWLTAIQGRDGNWGGSARVTALVVQALSRHREADDRAIRRGVVWLLLAQRPDGSWPARRGETELAVTASVLSALLAAGVRPVKPVVAGAVGWLLARQNADGGWGSAARNVSGTSDAPGTARAVAALLAAGKTAGTSSADLGVDWLVRAQQADGGWGDKAPGRGGPRRRPALASGLVLPLSALGQYVTGRGVAGLARAVTADPVQEGTGLQRRDTTAPVPAGGTSELV